MNHYLLLALLACYAVAVPAYEKSADKALDYGEKCDDKTKCAKDLVCLDGKCSYTPSKVGGECGGKNLTPRTCEKGLRCVYDKAKSDAPGKCQERTKENGGPGKQGEDCKDATQCNPGLECTMQELPDSTARTVCMPLAFYGETCADKKSKRKCVDGCECLNKESHKDDDGVSRCYVKDVKTVGKEGEPCEGKTNTICGPGFACKDGDSGRVCTEEQKGGDDDKLPKDGDDCADEKGNKGKCAYGYECFAVKMNGAKDLYKCVKHPTQGENCARALGERACAEGYECLNKSPQAKHSAKKCYAKGIKTVAAMHEGCEDKTNSICPPGMKCEDAKPLKGKWCVKDRKHRKKGDEGYDKDEKKDEKKEEKKEEPKPEEKKEEKKEEPKPEEKKEEPKPEEKKEEKKEEPKPEEKKEEKKEEPKPEEKKEEPKPEEKKEEPKPEEKKEEPKPEEKKEEKKPDEGESY